MIGSILAGVAVLALFGLTAWAPIGEPTGKGTCAICGRTARLSARPGKLAACRICALTDLTGHC